MSSCKNLCKVNNIVNVWHNQVYNFAVIINNIDPEKISDPYQAPEFEGNFNFYFPGLICIFYHPIRLL
jgi:hypothetical protein